MIASDFPRTCDNPLCRADLRPPKRWLVAHWNDQGDDDFTRDFCTLDCMARWACLAIVHERAVKSGEIAR
jgi:hypothetical protein